ncbi:hypothetical protein Tco_0230073, partial [Tanacetum coccineum]
MMEKVKAFNKHPTHKAMFDALAVSLSVNEDDMDMLPDQPIQKKRGKVDHDKDPSPNVDKDSKKKKKKKKNDPDASFSKKTKDQLPSSKGTTPSKSSKFDKTIQVEETIKDPYQEVGMHEEPVIDEVINVNDHLQDDYAPCQDMSKWFKKSPRPGSPDPEWSKDLNANAGQEQDWFPELE